MEKKKKSKIKDNMNMTQELDFKRESEVVDYC